MRFGSLLLLALPLVASCGSDGPDESVSGVFPSSAFLGRQVRVEISGDTTGWKDGATVSFGAGVTVENVKVASPTALFADVTVAPDAAPGLRDVVVTSGGSDLTMKEAFQLESAITLKFRGTVAQGSIATFAINNHDFDTPFDDTSTGDGLFTPIEYTNTTVEGPAGVRLEVQSVTPYGITGLAFFDIDAAAGPVKVKSGLDADQIESSLGEDLKVAARTATPLTANTQVSGMVEASWSSALYEFTPTGAPALVTVGATSASSAAEPGVAVLGPSGKFDDMIGYAANNTIIQLATQKVYAVYVDTSGGSGYSFNVRANSQMMTPATEAEPNNTTATAGNATALPFLYQNATLSAVGDVDWIKITTVAADMGKKIRVMTTGSDPLTDTVVQVFKANGTDAFGAASSDQGYHENYTSGVLGTASGGPGVYWVKVTASQDYFQPAHNAYAAAVWLE